MYENTLSKCVIIVYLQMSNVYTGFFFIQVLVQTSFTVSEMLFFFLFNQATDALKEAEKHDPESIHTQLTLYKLALADTDVEKGLLIMQQAHSTAVQLYSMVTFGTQEK